MPRRPVSPAVCVHMGPKGGDGVLGSPALAASWVLKAQVLSQEPVTRVVPWARLNGPVSVWQPVHAPPAHVLLMRPKKCGGSHSIRRTMRSC